MPISCARHGQDGGTGRLAIPIRDQSRIIHYSNHTVGYAFNFQSGQFNSLAETSHRLRGRKNKQNKIKQKPTVTTEIGRILFLRDRSIQSQFYPYRRAANLPSEMNQSVFKSLSKWSGWGPPPLLLHLPQAPHRPSPMEHPKEEGKNPRRIPRSESQMPTSDMLSAPSTRPDQESGKLQSPFPVKNPLRIPKESSRISESLRISEWECPNDRKLAKSFRKIPEKSP